MHFSAMDEDEEEETDSKVEQMMKFITHHYKVGKTRSDRIRLEELAANLSGIAEFLTNTSSTAKFCATAKQILDALSQATREQYRCCLAILAGRIL
jgi:hypothetical protein